MSRTQFTGAGRLLKADTIADMKAPTAAEVNGAKDLTGWLRQDGLNRAQEAATVDTATALDLFDTTDIGTRSGSFELTFYRDDTDDDAWEELEIGTRCYMIVCPFKLKGANDATTGLPDAAAGDKVEIWKVAVSARSNAAIGKDAAQTFTVTCAVEVPPEDDAVVAA